MTLEEPAADEVFCTSCGEAIKEEAEICPECGVSQVQNEEDSGYTIPEGERYDLEKVANKSPLTIGIVSFLITPLGYYLIGKTGLAIINLLTLNYLLLGPIVVPFHTYKIINDAQDELRRAGVEGY